MESDSDIPEDDWYLQATPKIKPSTTTNAILPSGMTLEYNEAKQLHSAAIHNAAHTMIPRRSLAFNDEGPMVSLTSKLSDLDRPMSLLPVSPSMPRLGLF